MQANSLPTLLFVVPEASFFLSHRLPLGVSAIAAGYRVLVACPNSSDVAEFANSGIEHVALSMPRGARNIFRELSSLWEHFRLFRELRPDLVHLVTAKPMLYGGFSAKLLKIPSVSAVTGLGFLFIRKDLKARLLRQIIKLGYRLVLNRKNNHVIFQNPDDRDLFASLGLTSRSEVTIIPGSGVDLELIRPAPLPEYPAVVLMPCRMIQDKGVLEFVKAARILRTRNSKAIFRLQGNPDPGNPTSIKQDELEAWVQEGVVEWIPHTRDINATLAKAHIIALPSYREAFPKTLVDAAAAGRACVASDVPGCRHAIVPGEAGLLFRVKDPENLADVLGGLLADESKISEMGKRARKLAENRYGIEQIVEQHLYIYAAILRR